MQIKAYPTSGESRNPKKAVTIVGQGVFIRVRRGMLQVEDGFPLEAPRRTRLLTRATERFERILFLAGSGALTVDALDWCTENEIPLVGISQSGFLRWTLLPGKGGESNSRLRRAQALAPFTNVGLDIARWIVRRKISGQRDTLTELGRPATPPLGMFLPGIEQMGTIPDLRALESLAADAYWRAWVGLPVHFAPPSYARQVPSHWLKFRQRGSPINNGARNATDPMNALLNYAYALAESEVRIACHDAGLDPYLGILHTDLASRRSLLYDLLEPLRPIADRLVLNLVMTHAFRPGEFWPLRDGRCRLDQDLCARLWPWMHVFRKALGPVMLFVLSRLRAGGRYAERAPGAPVVYESRLTNGQQRWSAKAEPPPLRAGSVCRSCGVLLEGKRDRLYCAECLPERRRAFQAAGPAALARLRADGRDPGHGGAAGKKRGATIAARNHERAEWDRGNGKRVDSTMFREEILPRLQDVPLRKIHEVTGLTVQYSSKIRRGLSVPHPRFWEALRNLSAQW